MEINDAVQTTEIQTEDDDALVSQRHPSLNKTRITAWSDESYLNEGSLVSQKMEGAYGWMD